VKQSSVLVLVGEELAEKLAALFKCRESRILAYFPAIFFERSAFKVQHPLVDNLEVRYTATHARTRTTHMALTTYRLQTGSVYKVPVLLDKMVLLKEKKEKERHDEDDEAHLEEPTAPGGPVVGGGAARQGAQPANKATSGAQKDSAADVSGILQSWGFTETAQPTGVVHLAPGCGPEGIACHIPGLMCRVSACVDVNECSVVLVMLQITPSAW
jgi:hypothetical protein